MNVEIQTELLKEALNKSVKIASKHVSLPVLSCLLIKAEGKSVSIMATNLELGIDIKIPAKVLKEGEVAVPADVLWNLISQIQGVLKIEIKLTIDNNLKIISGSSEGVIKTVPYGDFPSIPTITDPVSSLTIKAQYFAELSKSVLYSASISSIKPELSSILYYLNENDELVAVATDLFRLAEKKIALKKHKEFDKMLISVKNILEVLKVFQDIKGDIDIIVKDNQVAFIVEDIYVVSRTVDSAFPDYKQIIPKEYKTEVTLLKQDFTNALKILRVFTDKLQHLKFNIAPKNNVFEMFMKNTDIGESNSKITAKVEGESLTISFNFRYISDVLGAIPEDSIKLEFNGIGKAVVIRGVGNQSFLYLVMPLVTKNE
ncbi:MAG: DNA polymerase III subunit beta [Candidatus Zambryskibacteria bacterium CG10_big_fil_rev_8_21_14_0_10_42_12]|uniref:Beta sliding clamp n=1 Tax=Candidatus Zambryskibacteria bacterium CG10_big_fil_rev_8_21_14_0_10_42_12 TaxID=1975115 RepID=A0A2H0QSK4_9BACT|nr:MAG: DNA polymerase III subunit beta [Candidatus Zambryskibacteria bacterium CG10_big_fil_rev_8_21_14_0_10_42_12]